MTSRDGIAAPDLDLGSRKAEFGGSGWGRLGRGCLGLICALLGLTFLGAIIIALVTGHPGHLIHALVDGALFLAGGVALLWSIRAARRTLVEVYADGLVLREGPTATSCRWADVLTVTEKEAVTGEEVIDQALTNETRAFRLRLRCGKVIVLKSYIRGLARLGAMIQEQTLPHLLPGYRAKLDQGQRVEFGPICLHRDGIEVQQQSLPWAEVEGVKRKGGWIKIHRHGAWRSWKKVKLSDVPNAHVLLEMVAQGPRV